MTDLLITNVRLLQVHANQTLIREGMEIVVRGQRIEAVQQSGSSDPSQFRTAIDGRGMLAMPGLINTHAHVPMVIFRGLAEDVDLGNWFNEMWQLEANLEPEDVYWGMMLGLAEMVEAGVTSVADHYWHMDQAARAVEKVGTRALLGWAMFGSHGHEAIEKTGDFVREVQGTAQGRIRAIMAPHAPYTCDDEFLRASVRKAEALGVGIHIHAAETMSQTRASLAERGLTPIQVLEQTGVLQVPNIIAHLCGATEADLEILAKYPTGIAHAPKTYLKLAMGLTPIPELRQRGVAVGLATDGAVSNNTLDIFESLRLMAMTQKERAGTPTVLPMHEALQIATRESAQVFGLPHDLGSLEAGKLADLILVDLSGLHHQPLHNIAASLVYNVRAGDVQTVVCDGQVLMRDRKLLTLDKGQIIANVRERMERLARKVPGARIQVYNI